MIDWFMFAAALIREEWELAHDEIVAIGRSRAEREYALGRALLRAMRARAWERLGMATFYEYAERFVGLTPRYTEERLRVALALEGLPVMSAALAEGRVHWSAVREMTHVARGETEASWVQAAEGKTVGEIQRLAAEREPGDLPTDPARKKVRRQRVVLDLAPEEYATLREAIARLRRDSNDPLSEGQALLLMARSVLGGGDPGMASYQIQMVVCERCGQAEQMGRGVSVPVDSAVAEMCGCDAVETSGKVRKSVTPKVRREVVKRQKGCCAVTGCRNSTFTDVHHLIHQADGGGHEAGNLILLCAAHHVAYHRGALLIDGTWETGFTFLHADGSVYGRPVSPHVGAVLVDVKQVLKAWGLKEIDARSVAEEIRPHVGDQTSSQEALEIALRAWHSRRKR